MKSMLFALVTLFLNFRLLGAAAPDSFKLVVVWPNTFCLTEPCQLSPQSFTLHGLWPQANGKSLKDCTGVPAMDDGTLNAKKGDLNQYWPDLKHSKFEESKAFWKYEWNKHGTCSRKSPADYLNLVFALQKTYDVKQTYAQNSILPNNQQPYTYKREQFRNAIFNKHKLWTEIECKLKDSNQYLFQIFFCITAQGQFKNCSTVGEAAYIKCPNGKDVKFPPPPASLMVSADELEKRT